MELSFFIEESFATERNFNGILEFSFNFGGNIQQKEKLKENCVKLQGILLLGKSSTVVREKPPTSPSFGCGWHATLIRVKCWKLFDRTVLKNEEKNCLWSQSWGNNSQSRSRPKRGLLQNPEPDLVVFEIPKDPFHKIINFRFSYKFF